MSIFRAEKPAEEEAEIRLPRHIAIILDGNGRWAKKRGLPRTAGHAAGAETFRRIATYCKNIGVQYLTVYAFSTENWKRPREEIDAIMSLLGKYLREAVDTMERDHIRLKVLGDPSILPAELRGLIDETREISARYDGFQANVCINYGGRDEIVRSVNRWLSSDAGGGTSDAGGGTSDAGGGTSDAGGGTDAGDSTSAGGAGAFTEEALRNNLDLPGVPDPDLVIRTAGEMRLSNFLIWQSAYAEYYSSPKMWPDFQPEDLREALKNFAGRNRKFGGMP